MTSIRKITPEATYSVRNPVLRPNQPVESCYFDGDHLPTTAHYGFYENENLIGIASVFKNKHPEWQFEEQVQLRGMAVLEAHQKKGIGAHLVKHVIQIEKENHTKVIWFNARKNAVGFYQNLNFQIIGHEFDIKGVGPHFVMYQIL